MAPEHLYLHVPFCGHRCGYCDFVTVTGHTELHARYVDALITELRREQRVVQQRRRAAADEDRGRPGRRTAKLADQGVDVAAVQVAVAGDRDEVAVPAAMAAERHV